MTLLTADSFNRANSTNNLGTTSGSGTLDPRTWVQQIGTFGISSNQAYATAWNPSYFAIATVETSQADIDASLTLTALGGGLVFRYSDSTHFWILYQNVSGMTYLFRYNAGNNIELSTAGAVAGDTVRIVANGTSIDVYRNSTLLHTEVNAFNSTATKHGLFVEGYDGFNARIENFSVNDLVVAPPSVPYVGAIPILS